MPFHLKLQFVSFILTKEFEVSLNQHEFPVIIFQHLPEI